MGGRWAPATGSLGHPSTHSMGHEKTCRVPAYRVNSPSLKPSPLAHLPGQHSQPAAVEKLTHPKCCTTLGNMAASWSMDGYWYLQHREAQDGGYGTRAEQEGWDRAAGLPEVGREMPPTHKPPDCPPWVSRLPRALSQFGETRRQGTTAQAVTTQQAGR